MKMNGKNVLKKVAEKRLEKGAVTVHNPSDRKKSKPTGLYVVSSKHDKRMGRLFTVVRTVILLLASVGVQRSATQKFLGQHKMRIQGRVNK
jgi:hypothetical protein